MLQELEIAVLGAADLMGEAVVAQLAERGVDRRAIHALDHPARVGEAVSFGEMELEIGDAEHFDFSRVDVVLIGSGHEPGSSSVRAALSAGAPVIGRAPAGARLDFFRFEAPHPLLEGGRWYSVPSGPSLALAAVLRPLQASFGLLEVSASILQPASVAGRAGVEELARQTRALLNFGEVESIVFPNRIAFNLLAGSAPDEDLQMLEELRALVCGDGGSDLAAFDLLSLIVPAFFGHVALVRAHLRQPVAVEAVNRILLAQSGLVQGRGDQPQVGSEVVGSDGIQVDVWPPAASPDDPLRLWLTFDALRLEARARVTLAGSQAS